MDNGGEFKGAVLLLCRDRNINTITGRAYHPQSQGSIEQANKTFKSKLRAIQMETGTKKWAHLLSKIAKIMNSSTSFVLPRGVTLNEVQFGRASPKLPQLLERKKRRIIHQAETINRAYDNSILSKSSIDESSEEEPEEEIEEEEELSELHQLVRANQDLYNQCIIKSKKGVIIKYWEG